MLNGNMGLTLRAAHSTRANTHTAPSHRSRPQPPATRPSSPRPCKRRSPRPQYGCLEVVQSGLNQHIARLLPMMFCRLFASPDAFRHFSGGWLHTGHMGPRQASATRQPVKTNPPQWAGSGCWSCCGQLLAVSSCLTATRQTDRYAQMNDWPCSVPPAPTAPPSQGQKW